MRRSGRKWLAQRMMPHDSMFSAWLCALWECANQLGDEAVADGMRISGLVEACSYEGPEVHRSGRKRRYLSEINAIRNGWCPGED